MEEGKRIWREVKRRLRQGGGGEEEGGRDRTGRSFPGSTSNADESETPHINLRCNFRLPWRAHGHRGVCEHGDAQAHTHIHTGTHVNTHTHTHSHTRAHTDLRAQAHTERHMGAHADTHTQTCTQTQL